LTVLRSARHRGLSTAIHCSTRNQNSSRTSCRQRPHLAHAQGRHDVQGPRLAITSIAIPPTSKKAPSQTFGRPWLRCGDQAAHRMSRVCGTVQASEFRPRQKDLKYRSRREPPAGRAEVRPIGVALMSTAGEHLQTLTSIFSGGIDDYCTSAVLLVIGSKS